MNGIAALFSILVVFTCVLYIASVVAQEARRHNRHAARRKPVLVQVPPPPKGALRRDVLTRKDFLPYALFQVQAAQAAKAQSTANAGITQAAA